MAVVVSDVGNRLQEAKCIVLMLDSQKGQFRASNILQRFARILSMGESPMVASRLLVTYIRLDCCAQVWYAPQHYILCCFA